MVDLERLFINDCRERARISRGAANRVDGSKSTKCTLSTDNMTQREIYAKNGPVITYKLKFPMTDEEYKELPKDLKKLYRAKKREAAKRVIGGVSP